MTKDEFDCSRVVPWTVLKPGDTVRVWDALMGPLKVKDVQDDGFTLSARDNGCPIWIPVKGSFNRVIERLAEAGPEDGARFRSKVTGSRFIWDAEQQNLVCWKAGENSGISPGKSLPGYQFADIEPDVD